MEKLRKFANQYLIPTDFVVVERIDGVKFIVRTKEQGHNEPHIHIEDGSCEFVISLTDYSLLCSSGKVNQKKLKMAQDFIKENIDLFKNNWNEFSNGIKIDICSK